MSDAVVVRGDLPAARAIGHKRIERLLDDFWEVFLVFPFLWETYRFSLATLLFGTLVPIELVGRLVAKVARPWRS